MRNLRTCTVLLAVSFAGLSFQSRPSWAATLTVGPGEQLTTVEAGLAAAASGDTVLVKPGTYQVTALTPPSGVELIGEAGPVQTKLYAANGRQAILLQNVSGVTVDGFDIYAQSGVGPLTNGLVYIEDATDITVRNCFIHDAPDDGDVIKLNGSQDVVIESSIIWNPSERITSPGNFQECIDIRGQGDARITVRGCWLFHQGSQGDYLIYAKGGTTDLLWENNVFGPSAGSGWGNVPVETGHLVQSDPTQYESENFVVRNNLFVGLRGTAGFAFAGPNVSLLYNNVFTSNQDLDRAIIEISANPALAGGPALELYSLNNIFHQNGGIDIYRVRDAQSGQNLVRDYNIYDSASSGGDLDLADEANSATVDDPLFVSPAVPQFDPQVGTEQIRQILEGFQTQPQSEARGAGVNVWDVAGSAHPTAIAEMSERADAFSNTRPAASWDVGLYEHSTASGGSSGSGGTGASGAGGASGGSSGSGGASAGSGGASAGSGGTSAGSGGDAGSVQAFPPPEDDSGCGCEVVGRKHSNPLVFGAAVSSVLRGKNP